MKQRGPEHIKDIIKSILAPKNPKAQEQSEVFAAWAKTANKKILAHTRLNSIRKNELVINVDSSAWLYQLNLGKVKISKKLNKFLGKEQTIKLYFRLGEV